MGEVNRSYVAVPADDDMFTYGTLLSSSVLERSRWDSNYLRLRRASDLINASTVAIDNKIEQAMDLVKSHLMFAVREEVEILKENIKELTEKNNLLMEKNTQLELENSILRNAAAPETLAQLASSSSTTQQQQQQQPPPTSSS